MYHNISIIRIIRQYTLMINKNCRKVCAIFFSSCVLLRSTTSCYCKQSQHDPRDMDLAAVHLLYDTIVCLIKSQPTSAIRNTHKKKRYARGRRIRLIRIESLGSSMRKEYSSIHPFVHFIPLSSPSFRGIMEKLFVFATGLFTIHELIYNLPMPGLVFFGRRAAYHHEWIFVLLLTFPRRGSPTWNTSLFARDSAKNFLPTAISLPLLFLLNFFLPPSYAD